MLHILLVCSSRARKGRLKKVGGRWAEQKDESVADFVRREREQVRQPFFVPCYPSARDATRACVRIVSAFHSRSLSSPRRTANPKSIRSCLLSRSDRVEFCPAIGCVETLRDRQGENCSASFVYALTNEGIAVT